MLTELGNIISKAEKDRIIEEFKETLLDFCQSVIPNGSRRGDEWDCSDILNSELTEGDRGSCSVNLKTGKFKDQNESATHRKGGPYTLFCAVTGLKGAEAYRAMRKWTEDHTLPDGSKGVATGKRVELSEGVTIEATDDFERDRIKWIGVYLAWTDDAMEHGLQPIPNTIHLNADGTRVDFSPAAQAAFKARTKARNDNRIAWAISDIYSRHWEQLAGATQIVKDGFASGLAEKRGLSKEVFLWLIDNGYIALLYDRKEIKQAPIINEDGEEEEQPPQIIEHTNIGFPVCREVTTDDDIPEWAGGRDYIDAGHPPSNLLLSWKDREEMRKRGEPTIFFYGMHIPYTNKFGKQWRYEPKGYCPAHPYIIGDVSTADLVVIAESTWDIIAYIDLRKLYNWKRPWCAIGTRGAGNAKRIPAALIKEGAVVVRLIQNDAGNAAWVGSLPEMSQATHRELQPPAEDKDLNDWIKRLGADSVHLSLYGNRRP